MKIVFGKILKTLIRENCAPRKFAIIQYIITVYYIIYIYTEKGAFISLKELALFAIKTGIERMYQSQRMDITQDMPPAAMPPWTKRVSPTTAAI